LGQECRIDPVGYRDGKQEIFRRCQSGAAADASKTHVSVASMPTGAEIEVDGSFVGNIPSTINLPAGDHTVVVSKNG
jgi:PEGA domain